MKKILLTATAIALFAGMSSAGWAQTPPAANSAPGLPQAAPNFPAKSTPGAAAGAVAPAPSTTAASAAAPLSSAAPVGKKHNKRVSLQQHFDAANTSHDGKLTRAQATAANWGYVTKHFDVMDSTHKGYVTAADVHAYGVAAHAARAQRKGATPASTSTRTPGTAAAPATQE